MMMERTIKADMPLEMSAVVDRVEQFSQKRETISASSPILTVKCFLLPFPLPLLLSSWIARKVEVEVAFI